VPLSRILAYALSLMPALLCCGERACERTGDMTGRIRTKRSIAIGPKCICAWWIWEPAFSSSGPYQFPSW
jgi:hypothetical protein